MAMTQEQMAAMNRAASYNASITDVMNAHKAMSGGAGGQSSGGAVSPVSGATPKAKSVLGGSGKGGRRDYDLSDAADKKKFLKARERLNNDNSYGYLKDDGTYVGFFQDATDGGGENTSGNYFVGGGLFSALANAMKVRPSGAARAKNDKGEYIVPIADIGYRDFTDMRDRGGPQASGGKFQGGGGYSRAANLLYGLSGKDFGERVPYGSSVTSAPAPRGGGVGGKSPPPAELVNPYAVGGGFGVTAPPTVNNTAAVEDAYFGQTPQVQQDFSGLSTAPAVRSGLIGYNPQVTSGVVSYTPTPTQGVTDEVYLPAGTKTGSNRTSAQLEQAQRARDYMGFRNAGGQSSYEEWLQGIYR